MPNKNNNIETIVMFFVQQRLQNRKTQEQIASQTGIKLTSYQRFEQGKRDPKLSEVKLLCDYYKITWLDVAWGELGKRPASEEDLVAAVKQVPARIRQPILALIKAIGE